MASHSAVQGDAKNVSLPVVDEVQDEFASGRGTSSSYAAYIGDHLGVFTGYATASEDRQHVASGGLATSLLAMALREGLVDGVGVCKADFCDGDIGHRFDILTTPGDVQRYGTSAYFNIPIERYWKQIDEFPGKVALCALPCHTSMLRKRSKARSVLKNVEFYISLFCGHNNEPDLIRFVLEREGIPIADVESMRVDRTYLGGCVNFGMKDGSVRSILFRHFNVYRSLWFFSKQMCRYCDDHLGASADLSIGDVFTKEYRVQDVKHSAVVARTQKGLDVMQMAIDKGLVTCEQVAPDIVYRAQKRVIVPSGDLKSRYHACRVAGFAAKPPEHGRFRLRSFITYSLLLLNDRLSQTGWGRWLIRWIPRPLLYGYIASIKLINNSLRAEKL